jgi:hypothetical protein
VKKLFGVFLAAAGLCAPATAQAVLFDFDNAPLYSPLPITLTVGGITAQFSATGHGFSIQWANTMGFTPVGFAGLCIYPSSVFPADLLVSFAPAVLTDFSILYAPEEYGCDSSATTRVTAYMSGTYVGTNTTTAYPPGTWPTGTLTFSSPQGFNSVVVHYDSPPPTGGDWGPIFMADNMNVTPMGAVLRGDLNCDGAVNFGDINPFVLYLSNFAAWQSTYTCCDPANADINQDGIYPSFGDINPFVALLSGA